MTDPIPDQKDYPDQRSWHQAAMEWQRRNLYGSEHNPSYGICDAVKAKDDHAAHVFEEPFVRGGTHWVKCSGYLGTHLVTVTDLATGDVVVQERVDARQVGSYAEMELTLMEPYKSMTQAEVGGHGALHILAPEVCPFDSDRCSEHLYDEATRTGVNQVGLEGYGPDALAAALAKVAEIPEDEREY